VPKKEAMEFTREIALKTEHNTLKTGIYLINFGTIERVVYFIRLFLS
jgi:hypothetical protein